jgi:hypothetical protein
VNHYIYTAFSRRNTSLPQTLSWETKMANDMHSDGVDVRNGTYDGISPAGKQQPDQVKDATTPQQAAQHGADVRAEPLPGAENPIPEGLIRAPKGPMSPTRGRGN